MISSSLIVTYTSRRGNAKPFYNTTPTCAERGIETIGASKDDKGREFTVYWEFIPSHGNFGEKGLNGTKAKKVNIKAPSPTYPLT